MLGISIVGGAVALIVVAVVGAVLLLGRPDSSVARASVVVLPSPDLPEDRLASYYETLNNGQIAPTFAEVLRDRMDLDALDVTASDAARASARADIKIVPDTALLEVSVSARSDAVAIELADAIVDDAIDYVESLDQPYVLEPVADAVIGDDEGTPLLALLAVVAVIAIAAGLGAQQVIFQLAMLLTRRRDAR